jgi:putative transposase
MLDEITIERNNQVWCSDVTYIPMVRGFLYLVIIMDWVSRAVLAWRLSNKLGCRLLCRGAREGARPIRAGPRFYYRQGQSVDQ